MFISPKKDCILRWGRLQPWFIWDDIWGPKCDGSHENAIYCWWLLNGVLNTNRREQTINTKEGCSPFLLNFPGYLLNPLKFPRRNFNFFMCHGCMGRIFWIFPLESSYKVPTILKPPFERRRWLLSTGGFRFVFWLSPPGLHTAEVKPFSVFFFEFEFEWVIIINHTPQTV